MSNLSNEAVEHFPAIETPEDPAMDFHNQADTIIKTYFEMNKELLDRGFAPLALALGLALCASDILAAVSVGENKQLEDCHKMLSDLNADMFGRVNDTFPNYVKARMEFADAKEKENEDA